MTIKGRLEKLEERVSPAVQASAGGQAGPYRRRVIVHEGEDEEAAIRAIYGDGPRPDPLFIRRIINPRRMQEAVPQPSFDSGAQED